jgi:FkbM family methyltransferase
MEGDRRANRRRGLGKTRGSFRRSRLIALPSLKHTAERLLQSVLGFPTYLFTFSLFKIRTLRCDPRERAFFVFLELLPPGASVLDIGANLGVMTVHLARHVGGGTVYAFEPMADNLRTLHRVIEHFGLKNVVVFPCALGDRDGEVEMVMPVEGGVVRHGFSHVIGESPVHPNQGVRVKAVMRKLDSIAEVRDAAAAIKGIKMDVENFEAFVLEGGKQFLQRCRPVIYTEIWNNPVGQRSFDFLRRLGYAVKVAGEGKLVDFDPAKHRELNFICVPPRSDAR